MSSSASRDKLSLLFPQYMGDYSLSEVSEEGIHAIEEKRKNFQHRPPRLSLQPYWGERKFRQEFIFKKFGNLLTGRVLDVGCDEAALKKFVKGEYVGIDRQGNYDTYVDLNEGKIPFPDNHFDCVICTDVLEHIDQAYVLFDEVMRVTRKYAIFSFPNCWWGRDRQHKNGIDESRSYGLPPEPALDRHRWYFNAVQAEDFVTYRSAKHKSSVKEMIHFRGRGEILRIPLKMFGKDLSYPKNYPAPDHLGHPKGRILKLLFRPFECWESVIRFFHRMVFSAEKYRNRHATVVWCVTEKKDS